MTHQIKIVSSVELLFIRLDERLSFNKHISNIYRSAANQLNGLIKPKINLNFTAKVS